MESTAIMEMGNKIKTLRLAKSMTQEQLARALHVSAQAVSKWELGGSLPDIQLLPALSVVLGTSIDALFSLTDESRLARIENMLEDRRFLTQHEFETEERFLQEKCMEGSENVRAVLLLARLYCKRAGEYRALASPPARRALELDPQSKEAHTAVFAAENGAYPDWNVSNHSETIAFYKDFLAQHPEEYGAYLWLLDLLLADGRCGEAREYAGRLRAIRESFNDELYRGILCKQEGRIGEALDCWAAMCEKYGDMWQAWASRASELAKLCRYDEAAADYERAMSLMPHPQLTDPVEAIAQLCELRGDCAGAIRAYERVVSILREDWSITQGELLDAPLRTIARLREKLAAEAADV